MPHCPPLPLELYFQLSALEKNFFYGGAWHFFFPRRLEEYGKKHLYKLWKYVQSFQRSRGVKYANRKLCQVIESEISERKQQGIKSTKYSGLAQSHASLPITTTRALVSTLGSRNLHCQMQQNRPSSSIEHRLYLAASFRAKANKEEESIMLKEAGNKRCLRNQRKYVHKCQQSQGVEDARRQLCQVITTEKSESNKKWNRSNTQDWLTLMPHCPPLLELWFQLSALKGCVAKMQQNWPSSSIELRLYLAAFRWTRMRKEENIRLKQGGNKRYLRNQP